MSEREYEYTVKLTGYGETPREGWNDVIEAISSDIRNLNCEGTPPYTVIPKSNDNSDSDDSGVGVGVGVGLREIITNNFEDRIQEVANAPLRTVVYDTGRQAYVRWFLHLFTDLWATENYGDGNEYIGNVENTVDILIEWLRRGYDNVRVYLELEYYDYDHENIDDPFSPSGDFEEIEPIFSKGEYPG